MTLSSPASLHPARLTEAARHVLWHTRHVTNGTRTGEWGGPAVTLLLDAWDLAHHEHSRLDQDLARAFPEYGWARAAAGLNAWDTLTKTAT